MIYFIWKPFHKPHKAMLFPTRYAMAKGTCRAGSHSAVFIMSGTQISPSLIRVRMWCCTCHNVSTDTIHRLQWYQLSKNRKFTQPEEVVK